LHIQSGDAGTVTPSSQADDLVVEASTEGGITIMTPDNQSARIRFTSPSTETGDVGGADIFYRQNINKMSLGTTVSGGLLAFKAGAGVETMVLDNGNVGITNTPATDWHTDYKALQIGDSSAFFGKVAGTEAFFSSNAKYTSGGWKYITTGTANLIDMQTGVTRFRSAVSGTAGDAISLSTNMKISASGKVIVGTTSNNYSRGKFTVLGTPGNPATSGTNVENVAIRVATTTGNSQAFDIGMYNTSPYGAWLQASNSGGLDSHSPIVLNPNGGNVGIKTSSPNTTLELGPVSALVGPTLRLSGGTGGSSGIAEYPFGTVEFFSNDPSGDGAEVKASISSLAHTGSTAPGGEIALSTTNSGGSSTLTEHFRLTHDGNVGIGTDSPSALLEIASGAPTLILNADSQATNKKKIRLAASQFTAGDFNIQQMNDNGTTVALTALQINNGGELIVAGTVSIKDNSLTIDSDYGHWSGRHQTLVCHNAITASNSQVWTDVAFVSYSPSLTIQGTAQRDNSGSLGMASYFGTIFGGYGSVTVTATTNIANPMNGGGFGQLEYRYLNGGASSGAYRLQVRQAITTGTMYITTTLTGQAFNQITED
jgi:hypothetical protein